jgi:hypothetical protein
MTIYVFTHFDKVCWFYNLINRIPFDSQIKMAAAANNTRKRQRDRDDEDDESNNNSGVAVPTSPASSVSLSLQRPVLTLTQSSTDGIADNLNTSSSTSLTTSVTGTTTPGVGDEGGTPLTTDNNTAMTLANIPEPPSRAAFRISVYPNRADTTPSLPPREHQPISERLLTSAPTSPSSKQQQQQQQHERSIVKSESKSTDHNTELPNGSSNDTKKRPSLLSHDRHHHDHAVPYRPCSPTRFLHDAAPHTSYRGPDKHLKDRSMAYSLVHLLWYNFILCGC